MERTKKSEKPLENENEAPDAQDAPEVPENEAPEVPAVTEEPVTEEPVTEVKEESIPVDPDPIITWKKTGGGSLRLAKRLIPPGAIFKARVSEIPKGFRDVVIPMELIPEQVQAVVPPVKSAFQVMPRGKSKSMFDIIGANGKRMNEQPLTKAVAERLKADLER
jgi:hypothetical protein